MPTPTDLLHTPGGSGVMLDHRAGNLNRLTSTLHTMKLTRIITTAFAASALLFASCNKDEKGGSASGGGGAAVSEKDALDAFKKAAVEINALIAEGKAAGDPVAGLPKMKAAMEKMKAIKTEGLPADLKESFTAAMSGMGEMIALFKGMPADPAEIGPFMQKLMTDPKIAKLGETSKAATAKFKEVAAKYGVEIAE